MVLAVLISSSWFIAAIGAYYLLRHRAMPFARKTMSIGLAAAALLLPIQLYVGDSTASYMTSVYQPAKVLAAEGDFSNGNTGWNLIVIPDQAQQRNFFQLSLPHAASVFVYHNFSGEDAVPGLRTIPERLQPPVGPVFWGFQDHDLRGVGDVLGRLHRRHHAAAAPPVHRTVVLAAGAVDAAGRGEMATIAGWVVSESGRQPWLVYGKLLVTNSVSSLSTGELIASLAAFWIVYLGLFTAWVRQIVREVRRGPMRCPASGQVSPRSPARRTPRPGAADP
jgi:cytochrome d ubiquinol oxidase subunit I